MKAKDHTAIAADALNEAEAKAELKRLAAEIATHDKRYSQLRSICCRCWCERGRRALRPWIDGGLAHGVPQDLMRPFSAEHMQMGAPPMSHSGRRPK
jgi:hypothetical protein